MLGNVIYRVQQMRSSNDVYAKRLLPPQPGSKKLQWEYVGRAKVHQLTAANRMTVEQAKEFGVQFGMCVNCGATLTAAESVERAIGPVCIKKFHIRTKEVHHP